MPLGSSYSPPGAFAEYIGPTDPLDSDSTPLDFFLRIFGKDTFTHLAEQTNLYASQNPPSARYAWEDTSANEMMLLLGIIIASGVHSLPEWQDYWSQNPILGSPAIVRGMPLTRFKVLMRCLHVNDNSTVIPRGQSGFDKLHKVRPLINEVNRNSLEQYSPHREVSIDEAMVPFKGRSTIKQFMPQKPIKRGFKVWCRADACNGFINQIEVYTGKNPDGPRETELGKKVVHALTAPLGGKGYFVFFDNFFSSVGLAKSLLEKKLYCIGTARTNRALWPAAISKTKELNKTMKRGDVAMAQSGSVNCIVWKDNKCVAMINTITDPQSTTTMNRREKTGNRTAVPCPEAVKVYNSYMGGVDLADARRKTYSCSRKSKKWWHRLFFFLVDLSVTNGYILASETPHVPKMSQKDFILELAEEMLSKHISRKRHGRRSTADVGPSSRFNDRHFPDRIKNPLQCVVCGFDNVRRRVMYACTDCNPDRPIPLCAAPCFGIYHKRK